MTTTEQAPPGADLATVNLNPADLYGQMELAKVLGKSSLLPQALRGKPADVLVTVLYGRELGLSPMQAIQGIYVVNGRPSMAGQLWLAKIRQAGHKVKIQATDKEARCTITRHDDPDNPHTEVFTIAEAERAKLTGKDVWKAWPKRMLTWRAVSNCATVVCPEVALGFDVAELVADEAQAERPTLAQVAAQREQPAASADRPPPVREQEPVDADVVDEEEIRAAVETLHAQATGDAPEDDGWPETLVIPGAER